MEYISQAEGVSTVDVTASSMSKPFGLSKGVVLWRLDSQSLAWKQSWPYFCRELVLCQIKASRQQLPAEWNVRKWQSLQKRKGKGSTVIEH